LELNWSTFALEIINFLVLVWILKRFLYRPVVAALTQRREQIAEKLDEASRLKSEGSDLLQQYESRLQDWEREKQQARDSLQEEIRQERIKKLEKLETELADARQKAATIEERRRAEERRRDLETAHVQGAKFAAKLLEAVAGPELESRLFEVLLRTLDEMSEEKRNDLQARCASSDNKVTVSSVFPMNPEQLEKLRQKLTAQSSLPVQLEHRIDPALIAGFRIVIDALVLHLNIQDELEDYAGLYHGKNHN